MTKIDINKILDLHFINHQSKHQIYLDRAIKYGKRRIKELIKISIKEKKDNADKPKDYINKLYSDMNYKHLEREKCNRFIIKNL